MYLRLLSAIVAVAGFLFIWPLGTPNTSADLITTYDFEFEMGYRESLAEGNSGSLRGIYTITSDSEDEVYWNVDYTCGYHLILADDEIAYGSDYEVIFENDIECEETSLGWEYLISQGESYSGGITISGQDFIQDGAHYWYYFELYTTDEGPELSPVTGDFTIEFDDLDEPFSDVNGHWAEDYINALATMDDVSGYDDGTFKPDQEISRAEALIVTINALSDPTVGSKECNYDFDLGGDYSGSFDDIDSSHWAFSYIESAYEAGVVSGYEDGTFRPNDSVTRAEALSILIETYFACGDYNHLDTWYTNYDRHASDPVENNGRFYAAYEEQGYEVASEENLSLGFSDVVEDWKRFYAHFGDIHGMVDGYTNDEGSREFRPDNAITRAELAKLAWMLRANPHDPEPF